MREPTIYKPSIYNSPTVYNNGGGGGTNKDGSIKVASIYNVNRGNIRFNVSGVTLATKVKIKYREYYGSSVGIFRLTNGSDRYIQLLGNGAVDVKTRIGTQAGLKPLNPYNRQYATIFESDNLETLKISQCNGSEGQISLSNVEDAPVTKCDLFIAANNWYGPVEIMSVEIGSLYKLTAAVKNGVAGFYDEINGTFLSDSSGYNELYPMYYE